MKKTLGLALGSGGARGVAHIGFLQALEEEGIKPDYIAGCSMGAVIGGCYASGISPKEIKKVVLKLKPRDIVDVSPAVITKMAILRSKKIQELLETYLGDKKIEELEIPFRCVATELHSGKLHVFKKGNAARAVQASSSIPTVFRPVRDSGKLFVDGGCMCRVPIKVVKDMGSDVVVALDVLKNTEEHVGEIKNIVAMALRVFDIMDANQTNMSRKLENELCDLYLEPEMTGHSQYAIKDLDTIYGYGYELGKENTEKIKELLS